MATGVLKPRGIATVVLKPRGMATGVLKTLRVVNKVLKPRGMATVVLKPRGLKTLGMATWNKLRGLGVHFFQVFLSRICLGKINII